MSHAAIAESTPASFDVAVGTKRQFTIPVELYRQLGLKAGDPLRLTLHGETVKMEPLVSVPRHTISKELLAEMESRRGAQEDDISLEEFLAFTKKMRADRKAAEAEVAGEKKARTAGRSKAVAARGTV